MGLPGGSVVKNPPANAGDTGLIIGLARYPGDGNGNSLQYSCLENPMDRGVRWATVYGVQHNGATEHEHGRKHLLICILQCLLLTSLRLTSRDEHTWSLTQVTQKAWSKALEAHLRSCMLLLRLHQNLNLVHWMSFLTNLGAHYLDCVSKLDLLQYQNPWQIWGSWLS